jgi:hypothetical protein
MSGGSMEYVYSRVYDAATTVRDFAADERECYRSGLPEDDPRYLDWHNGGDSQCVMGPNRMPAERRELYRRFAAHLDLVAKALRAIEWTHSGDTGDGDEDEAIRAALGGER